MNFKYHRESEAIFPYNPNAICDKIVITLEFTTDETMSKDFHLMSLIDPVKISEVNILKSILKFVKGIKEKDRNLKPCILIDENGKDVTPRYSKVNIG